MQLKYLIILILMLNYIPVRGHNIRHVPSRKHKRSDMASLLSDGISEYSGGSLNCGSAGKQQQEEEEEKRRQDCSNGAAGGVGVGGNPRQKASSIAQKAAKEAKAAENAQSSAGAAAAHAIKEQLAERAHQAAVAAEAALAGKKQIDDELEHEVREAEGVVQEESASLQSAEVVVQAAIQAHEEANRILKLLTEALRISQSNVGNAETAANGAQAELAEKTALVEAAKNRVELLLRQLSAARADLANTKQAENVAEHAAHAAKQNANKVDCVQ